MKVKFFDPITTVAFAVALSLAVLSVGQGAGADSAKNQSRFLTGPVETPAGVSVIPHPFDELFPPEPLQKSDRLRGSSIAVGKQATFSFLLEQLNAQAEAEAVFRWQQNFGNTPEEWLAGHFRI